MTYMYSMVMEQEFSLTMVLIVMWVAMHSEEIKEIIIVLSIK